MRVTFVTGRYQSGRVAIAKNVKRELSRTGRRVAWTDHNHRDTKDFGTTTVRVVSQGLRDLEEIIVSGPETFLLSVCAILIGEGIPPVVQRIDCGDWKCE